MRISPTTPGISYDTTSVEVPEKRATASRSPSPDLPSLTRKSSNGSGAMRRASLSQSDRGASGQHVENPGLPKTQASNISPTKSVALPDQGVPKSRKEKLLETYPDTWENKVLVGRSAVYDPPAAALKRGDKLEDVLKQFGYENDPEEAARLTELADGGLRRNEMWWS